MNDPLVSIITPTTISREPMMRNLLQMVAAQDYPNYEHIIVDDEDKGCFKKRNIGCERAKGEILLNMDTDDYFANDWISKSVEYLLSSDADMTGLKNHFYYNFADNKAYRYVYSFNNSEWLADGSLCFLKSFWQNHKYDERYIFGSDNLFVWSCNNVKPHNYENGFVAQLHTANTSPKNIDRQWQPIEVKNLPEFFVKGWRNYGC